jgi:hypothetical protein
MSRHHIQPPPIYMPPTPPKPAARKTRTTRMSSLEQSDETSETDQTEDSSESDRVRRKQAFGERPSNSPDDFDVMKRKSRTPGRLSEATLKTLLTLQEVGR